LGDMFRLILSHHQALFLRYRSLIPTLKMRYEIPNAYNFYYDTVQILVPSVLLQGSLKKKGLMMT